MDVPDSSLTIQKIGSWKNPVSENILNQLILIGCSIIQKNVWELIIADKGRGPLVVIGLVLGYYG